MLAPSNPKSSEISRIEPYFPNPSDGNNVIDSHSMFVGRKKGKKIPLPPEHKSSSRILAPLSRKNLTLDEAIEYELKHGRRVDPNMDKKQLRRTISNRLSAQRSRIKRSQYINDMEKMVKELEDKISVLTPQIEIYIEQRKQLQLQNDSLKNLIEIRSNESRISEMLLEQKRVEICRLKEVAQTMKNNSHEPNSVHEQMQDLRLSESTSQPYSLEFYQNRLQNFESNQQQGFMTEQPVEVLAQEKVEEDEDIDQYLNFEELNLDPASA